MKKGKIVAIIPAYNEEDRIKETIEDLKKVDLIDNIVVIDDGSTDSTSSIVENMGIDLIKLNKNRGKGFAIKEAVKRVDYDYLVLADGDLGKTSNEIEKLIYPVLNNEADVAIAKFPRPLKKGGFGFVKRLAKRGVYIHTGKKIDTTLSGQRVYKREVVQKINYIPDRFGVEIAMTVATLREGYSIKEVDVNMRHRETGRDFKDFIHRGKQFFDILKTIIILFFRR
ncbi:glycosyltransferase family 2 protein [Anaerosalibacter bizertensis]|uniref:Glycosyltransferase family 2 protein n=1 Tax=Anaerosalibacter bizertensis TaxID=932217 RepID=A0A844FG00_9FIRM|nr:glycosyltransferase family 2 protein [Anaerosalibacter bizertensis]MBV1817405.1 glycosyltransferase family 2 protein [Bacteroidales bacterium MSK.15.36]HHV27739.1 glycosyltransferase family 2 protein [Tissierellia bacterium]MBU5293180.1 glycosyltransferase family 2 protein [Anaerosalibacter bizertensis]MCB5558485.1 glycosyltransferase family 2 protein [Anaerosalibacter bizertensis]MCG4564249.1 glycosyltransferase family 2 protein [Anaerosalibacter bizertensis]